MQISMNNISNNAPRKKATRNCPVCGSSSQEASLFLENSIDSAKLSGFSFASRKAPEYMSHHLVQCAVCDLVYADEPPDEDELAHAYHTADFDSSDEANDAASAYIKAIRPALATVAHPKSALEIGCGTGVFLEYLRQEGFAEVVGVEPSQTAIATAPLHRQAWIRHAMFDEKDFIPESFDLICCFMTMEHVRDPQVIARSALKLLRPGGVFITVTHNYQGWVNRVLAKRSPIVDIEHLQLFSNKSLLHLFENTGFLSISIKAFVNTYSLSYWLRLMPLPDFLKKGLSRFFSITKLGKIKAGVNVGNLVTFGRKQH
jgi:2-polyprenyl-3-methyl-5-hydroxy-6-metoxy-1,4-benzoquinol methylase